MKPYLHDRLLAATVLKMFPADVRPNHVTIFRMLMTPFVLWVIWRQDYEAGIPLFLLVAFTDMLDGSLARTRGLVTEWGTIWDPVADKLLIGSVAVLLLTQYFPPELTVAIVGIELAFLAGGYYRKTQGRIVGANWWGKMKMLMQVAGMTLFLLWLATGVPWLEPASYVVFGVAAVFAVASFFAHGL